MLKGAHNFNEPTLYYRRPCPLGNSWPQLEGEIEELPHFHSQQQRRELTILCSVKKNMSVIDFVSMKIYIQCMHSHCGKGRRDFTMKL